MPKPITDETLMGSFEEKRDLVRSFTMFDDTFFSIVMEDKTCCEEAVRVLTGISDLTVIEVKTQYSIRNLGTHSVVLDVLAEDSRHRLYNIEIQGADNDDHQKRVRYYQSNIDISYLDKGKDYKDLPEVYLIYMTKFDIFKLGQSSYIVGRYIQGKNVVLDNGVHEIYVNSAVYDRTETAELMRFFQGTEGEHSQFPKLSKRIQYFKEEAEGVELMCEAVQKYGDQREAKGIEYGMQQGMQRGMEQGMQQGMKKGLWQGAQENTQQVVKEACKMKLPLEAIAQLVRLPVAEVQKMAEKFAQE